MKPKTVNGHRFYIGDKVRIARSCEQIPIDSIGGGWTGGMWQYVGKVGRIRDIRTGTAADGNHYPCYTLTVDDEYYIWDDRLLDIVKYHDR